MPPISPEYWDQPAPSPFEIPLNPVGYDNSGRVNADLENIIDRTVGTGDVLEQEFRDVGPAFWRNYLRYMGLGDEAYRNLSENAGYTPEEAAQIQDYDFLRSMIYGQDEYNDLFLTPGEQFAATGDPFGVFAFHNPEAVRGQVRDFRDRGREAIAEGGGRMRGAIGETAFGVDPSFIASTRGALNRARGDSALDEAALRLRPGFLDDFQMSDEEVGDIADLGARTASSRWDAAYDDTARRAGAAGTMGPAALAALRGRLDRRSNIDAADAATSAMLQGKGLQRDLLGRGEQMRLGSEQYIADANLARALEMAGLDLSAEQGIEDRRYRGATDRLNSILDTEGGLMSGRLSHETNVGNLGTGVEQYLNDTGTGLFSDAESTRSNRAFDLGQNRQNAAQQGQTNRREFGFGSSDRTRFGARDVADARRDDEQRVRDYVTGQQQAHMDAYGGASGRRVDAATGMANAALGGSTSRRQRRDAGFWERNLLG